MTIARRAMLLVGACALATAAWAQAIQRIRGTIDSTDGHTIQVTSRSGEKFAVSVRSDTRVTLIAPATLADIAPGSYIGTAALPMPDGTLRALEVQVFPPSMRGSGEGHRPYDLQPQSTMTNGTVGDVVGTEGRTLTLRYAGGEQKVTVPANAPIITYEPGTTAMLAAGAHVIVTVSKTPDGGLSADRVSVGKDGLMPPM